MFETDPAVIDAQVDALVDAQGAYSFLSNFAAYLPGGIVRTMVSGTPQLELPLAVKDIASPQPGDLLHSPRAFTVSCRTFFGDIDQSLSEAGIDAHTLDYVRDTNVSEEERERRYRGLLPAYKILRMLGYSHHDLRM